MLLTTPISVGVVNSMVNYIGLSGILLHKEQNTTPIVQNATPIMCCLIKTQFSYKLMHITTPRRGVVMCIQGTSIRSHPQAFGNMERIYYHNPTLGVVLCTTAYF